MTFFKHPNALCESEFIGRGTKIWANTHILPGAIIGEECNICDFVFIENDVQVGDRVTIKSGVQLWDGIRLEDDVFVGPNVTFTNDKFPRSKGWQKDIPVTVVEHGASIGGNSTILPGLTIGKKSMIGAGSVVTRSIPPFAIAYGNPARIHGFVTAESTLEKDSKRAEVNIGLPFESNFSMLKQIKDVRGCLTAFDFDEFDLFEVRRFFYVSSVPAGKGRGGHAHKQCFQFLFMLSGEITLLLDDGDNRSEVKLRDDGFGVLIPPMVWANQSNFSGNAILGVLASHKYDPSDYIHDYQSFQSFVS